MDISSATPHTPPAGAAQRNSAPHNTAPHNSAPHNTAPAQLQAVSLRDYEQLVTARATFVDFLLRRADAA